MKLFETLAPIAAVLLSTACASTDTQSTGAQTSARAIRAVRQLMEDDVRRQLHRLQLRRHPAVTVSPLTGTNCRLLSILSAARSDE